MNARAVLVASGLLVASAGAASAATQIQFDLNSFTARIAPGATGFLPLPGTVVPDATPTGRINFSIDNNTSLALLFDGSAQAMAPGFSLTNFDGFIDLNAGSATDGRFTITVSNGVETDTYTALVRSGETSFIPSQGYGILGTFWQGEFSDSTFAGLDVANFFAGQGGDGLFGNYLNFKFLPNAGGVDVDTDLDLFVVIPLPGAGGLALAGMGVVAGVGGLRRRR